MKRIKYPLEYKISLIYFTISFFWILFSDLVVDHLITDIRMNSNIQTYKGWGFITITAILIFYMIRKRMKASTELTKELIKNQYQLTDQIAKTHRIIRILNKKNKKINIVLLELNQAKKEAEKSDKLKTAFLNNISHEVRSPLNAILGFSNILINQDRISNDSKQKFLQILSDESNRLNRLIDNMLELAQLNSNTLSFNKEENICAKNIITNAFANYNSTKLIDFKMHNDIPESICQIKTDRKRLSQILENLISNAFNNTTKGSITIGSRVNFKTQYCEIYVKDTGKGISDSQKKIIFESFRKTDESTRGVGLGLAISKILAINLGYDIYFNSTPGVGSEFVIVLDKLDGVKLAIALRENHKKHKQNAYNKTLKTKTLIRNVEKNKNRLIKNRIQFR